MASLSLAIPGISPAWSPDGQNLAYVRVDYQIGNDESDEEGLAGATRDSVCIVRPDGQGHRFLGVGYWPKWGLDGKTVYYVQYARVIRVSRDGDKHEVLRLKDLSLDQIHLAPNGHMFGFVGTGSQQYSLYCANIDGSNLRCLIPPSEFHVSEPSWSPDSTSLAFNQKHGVQIVDVTSSDTRTLVPYGHDPTWSPRDNRIAFYTSWKTEPFEGYNPQKGIINGIHILDVSSGRIKSVACDVQSYRRPFSWSPDGRHLAFVQDIRRLFHKKKSLVGILDVDKGTIAELWEGVLEAWSPVAWSPDSCMVAASIIPPRLMHVFDLTRPNRT